MSYTLKFDFQSYWRIGTGRGGGALLDETTFRDNNDLPILPGRSIKGILRDAVWRMEQWAQIPENTTERWFGTRLNADGFSEEGIPPRRGTLRLSNATLDNTLRDYLLDMRINDRKEFSVLKKGFYQNLYATAIKDGHAEEKSLRAMEVTIPVPLYASLYIEKEEDNDYHTLSACLPLIRAMGNQRSRGLGRVTVTLLTQKEVR